MNFYIVPTTVDVQNLPLQQGDLLFPIPFVGFSLTEAHIIPPNRLEHQIVDLTTADDPLSSTVRPLPDGSNIIASIRSGIGIIVNQTCDLACVPGREKPILVASVIPCATRIPKFRDETTKAATDQINELRNPGRFPSLFYLPSFNGNNFSLARSVADLLQSVCLPPSNLLALAGLVQLRLTIPALQAFQERLAYCFGRFGAPDDLFFNEEEWQHIRTKQSSSHQGPR